MLARREEYRHPGASICARLIAREEEKERRRRVVILKNREEQITKTAASNLCVANGLINLSCLPSLELETLKKAARRVMKDTSVHALDLSVSNSQNLVARVDGLIPATHLPRAPSSARMDER